MLKQAWLLGLTKDQNKQWASDEDLGGGARTAGPGGGLVMLFMNKRRGGIVNLEF